MQLIPFLTGDMMFKFTLSFLITFLCCSVAFAQNEKEQIFAHTNASLEKRATYMKANDFKCATIKVQAQGLCRAYNYKESSLRNTDGSIRKGRKLLAFESMVKSQAAACKMDAKTLWTDKCAASKKALIATWKDQVDTTVRDNQTLLQLMDRYLKRNKQKSGLRMTRTIMKTSYNWRTFNAQLGIKHQGYENFLKKVAPYSKAFEKHELKRIANHTCPKGKYKNKKFVKELMKSAQLRWDDAGHVNAKYKVKSIRLSRKPFTHTGDDGSKEQKMPSIACIKAVFPNRTACFHYTFTAKRNKYAKVKSFEPWQYHFERYGDEFPCKKLK